MLFRSDVIISDLRLPGAPGTDLIKATSTPVLIMTSYSSIKSAIDSMKMGAVDYIAKPFSPRELIARIRAVLRRRAPPDEVSALQWGDLVLDVPGFQLRYAGQAVRLGPIEFRLLASLMRQPSRVFSRRQLLDLVWGDQAAIEERTVDVHIKRLRESLGEASHWVETVRGVGYRMAEAHAH